MTTQQLFRTVPDDVLKFGIGSKFQPRRVADLLSLEKSEVSRIAEVSPASVRYDKQIPKNVRDRLEEIASVCNLVAGFFDGDPGKTALWFKTKNPMLGDIAPRDMVRLGRYDRLRKFVISAVLEQNKASVGNRKGV